MAFKSQNSSKYIYYKKINLCDFGIARLISWSFDCGLKKLVRLKKCKRISAKPGIGLFRYVGFLDLFLSCCHDHAPSQYMVHYNLVVCISLTSEFSRECCRLTCCKCSHFGGSHFKSELDYPLFQTLPKIVEYTLG